MDFLWSALPPSCFLNTARVFRLELSTKLCKEKKHEQLFQSLQTGGGATPPRLLAKSRRGRSATTRSRQQACCRGSHTGGDDHPPCSAEEHVAQPCANKGAQRTVCQEESRRPAMAGPSGESRGEKPFLGVVPENSERNRRMKTMKKEKEEKDG